MSTKTTALTLVGGAELILGQDDQSPEHYANVTIGSDFDGWNGIVCLPVDGGGCLIGTGGAPNVVIQGQQNMDIDLEDGAYMNVDNFTIGFPPSGSGFGKCPAKPDTGSSHGPAILLHGSAAMGFSGTIQCIDGTAIELEASPNGSPTLDLGPAKIQNSGVGLHVTDGTATLADTGITFNVVGVWQDQDGGIDLTGKGVFGVDCTAGSPSNAVACNSGKEIGQTGGGVSVRNTSASFLNACNVAWDKTSPDLFMCDSSFNNCTCEVSSCSEAGGAGEDMDAVYTNGPILIAGSVLVPNVDCGSP